MGIPANRMRGRFISISPPNRGPDSDLENGKGEQTFQFTIDHPSWQLGAPCMPYSPGFKDKLIERESEAVRNNSTMRPLLAYGALAKGISHRLSLARKFGANIVASVSGSGTRAPRLRSEGNSLRAAMCCGPGSCLVERCNVQPDPPFDQQEILRFLNKVTD